MRFFLDERQNNLALALRSFAEAQAQREGTVWWKVLRSKAIIGICNKEPMSIEALSLVKPRLKMATIQKHGEQIVAIVLKHCQEDLPFVVGDPLGEKRADRVMHIKQGGFYYSVSGNDALLLHKHLGYKLYGVDTPRTGFPVKGKETVLEKLEALSIDYDLINQGGKIVASRRFAENLYEIVDDVLWGEVNDAHGTQTIAKGARKKLPYKERMASYIEILQGLSEGVDTMTGEVVEGLTEQTKLQLFEMSLYFDERLKARERLEEDTPKHGQRWTEEEDEALLASWQEGKTVKELAEMHSRTQGAIRSRLMKLEVQIL